MADAILAAGGIYAIRNTVTGKTYIGSAVNIKSRWSKHQSRLRKNDHHSPRLQSSWNKHGEAAFQFLVIELITDRAKLIEREQYWIDSLGAAGRDGYNVLGKAGSALGYKHTAESIAKFKATNKGRKFSEDHKAKLSQWQIGTKQSDETRARRSAALKGRSRPPELMAKIWATRRQNKLEKEISA